MSERRRPPSLRPGRAPSADDLTSGIPQPDDDHRMVVMFGPGTSYTGVTVPRSEPQRLEKLLADIADSIFTGKTLTLHDPDGSMTILNPAHIVRVEVSP